ncbi:MAG: tetratricopeptide repeat protein, partial [Anaerolineae bacterium]|nr:tetratricopeptide repeat protein [Anaerolineae bacterium]
MTWTSLRDQIDDVFSGEEFASLCFELGLSADQWTVDTKKRKIELFLLAMYEKDRLNDLGAALHKLRHNMWPSATLGIEASAPPFEAAPVSQLTISSAGGLVNTGTMTVGGDVVGGNQDKRTIINIYRVPKWLPIPIVIFFVVILAAGWLIKPIREAAIRQVHDWGWNWTQPEGLDETLILVATFPRSDGMQDAKPHEEIRAGILNAVKEMSNSEPKINLRVEVIPSQLTDDDQAPAKALGQRYNASLIIWGHETAARTTVNFLNLKQPKAQASDVKISETERSQLADPKAYVQLVTRDLPNQMRFLALFAVGQAYYQKGKAGYESSFNAIDSAVKTQLPVSQTVTGLTDAYFHLGWLNNELKRELTQTIKLYDRVIALDQNVAAAYNNRGIVYADLKQYERAIQDYDKVIALDQNDAAAYNNRGLVYADLKPVSYTHL